MTVGVVGVVGAGVIGTSVAQSLALTGHAVVLVDVSEDVLEHSLKTLRREARLHHLVAKTGEKVDAGALLERVHASTEMDDLRQGVKSFTSFGNFSVIGFTMIGLGDPREVRAGVVDGSYFDVMGLHPVMGRLLGPADDGPSAAGASAI